MPCLEIHVYRFRTGLRLLINLERSWRGRSAWGPCGPGPAPTAGWRGRARRVSTRYAATSITALLKIFMILAAVSLGSSEARQPCGSGAT